MATGEIERIMKQMDRAFQGNAWHGPSVMRILRGITSNQASARLFPGTHTVRELVAHMTAWKRIIARRVSGEVVRVTPAQDWPSPKGSWADAVTNLGRAHRELVKAVSKLPASRLGARVPGKGHDFYIALHGMVQHDLYHTGQIALLKKALTS